MQRRHFMIAGTAGCAGWPALSRAAGKTVRIGQSASLSGTQTQYGKDVNLGLTAAFAAANKAEGHQGLNFELIALDDGGVKERVVTNAKSLIDGGAQALVGFTSGIGAQDCLPMIEQSQIALIGTASGNMGIRGAGQAGTAHVRAGYDIEYRQMTAYVHTFGFKKVGFVYLQDTSKINLATMTAAMDATGINPPAALGVDRNGKDAQAAAKQLLEAKLDCVVFTTNATPALAIMKAMTAAGFPGMFFVTSLAGQDLIDGVPSIGRSVVMSLVVPRPTALGVGVVSQCGRDLAAMNASTKMGVTVLEGYIAGRVAVEAARQAAQRGDASRQRIRESLANLKLDLGGYRVAYESGGSQGSKYVDLVVIDRFGHITG
ncbi:MAG TPA: ABC transporter substrate-binding protein [Ideonella sp.]|jgi:ABC-type branched-subunit amino acid transport system substrate-binding protein|nr:ABC transporter substrate-binding protein [Ideonella sp.]